MRAASCTTSWRSAICRRHPLTVSNVDGFRGIERRVIILSYVLSSLGYFEMATTKPTTTGMTPAVLWGLSAPSSGPTWPSRVVVEALFIVGNIYALDGDIKFWSPLVNFYHYYDYNLYPPPLSLHALPVCSAPRPALGQP